jgi:lipopolysaccharide export system protein LptA
MSVFPVTVIYKTLLRVSARFIAIALFWQQSSAFEASSDDVSFYPKKRSCVLSGNATIIYDEQTKFRSDKIVISYKKGESKRGSVKASGNVRFCGQGFDVESNTCECDMKSIMFVGGVIIRSAELGEIKADSAVYDIQTKKISITSKKKVIANLRDGFAKKLKSSK